jgi:uncharacterized protein YqgC (DUF456 family)
MAGIAGLLIYTFTNSSTHTGIDPYWSVILFGSSSLLAVFARLSGESTMAVRFALIAGVIGIFIVIGLDQSNRLVYYDRWIDRGMP